MNSAIPPAAWHRAAPMPGAFPMPRAIILLAAIVLIGAARPAAAMDLQLKGKTALVTGSTAGIGYATAEALLKEGADVIINSRSQESVDKAAASLQAATGRTPKSFVGDMGKADDTARLAQTFPNVDILVNNVGTFMAKEFLKSTDEDWEKIYQVNVMSGVRLSRAYLPRMKQQNWGRIIFISSESALQIPVESIHYGMTKAAQIAVARGLAEDGRGATRGWRCRQERVLRSRPAARARPECLPCARAC